MCGIFGTIGQYNGNIKPCLEAISHRGPDDWGIVRDKNVSLGFRRLSIIDLSPLGNQPMSNEDSTVWIIFNGEIYNYQEIKKTLSKKHRFKSKTDSEVLIHGYEEWGIEKLLPKLNGMFAFCLYDKQKGVVYLVRDRIGKKPLYFYKTDKYFAFSSETKAFFRLKDFSFQIDDDLFDQWMGFPYLPDNRNTIIKNITKVPPAHYLKISTKDLRMKSYRYWHIQNEKFKFDFEDACINLENLLIDSIKKRLVADVPLAILLSGGLDSSLIAAIANRYSDRPIKTINISFSRSSINEQKYARLVSKHCHTDHINLTAGIGDTYNFLTSSVRFFDDLTTIDGGLLSSYLLAKRLKEVGIKVVLVGEGADEVFGGYSWFQLSRLPLSLLPDGIRNRLYYFTLMRNIRNSLFSGYPEILSSKLNRVKETIFKKIQRYEIEYSLPNHYCLKVDKGIMAASVEARNPYLDYRVVNFAHSIPDNYILSSNWVSYNKPTNKYILRKIAEKYLPREICYRPKKGGMLPVDKLLEVGIRKHKDLMLDNARVVDYYGREYLEDLIGQKSNFFLFRWKREWILWKCLIFSLWFDYYNKL
jgi:asparagine synthase (glutamine-hydrolysing)